MKILVLGGGTSNEREISQRSANNVAEAASQAGYEVQQADPADGLGFLDNLTDETIVFPILHGAGGEDGVIQEELEKRNLPYLGSDSQTSKNCWDKHRTLITLKDHGIKIARGDLVTYEEFLNHETTTASYVLKVVHGGSSLGVLIVRDIKKVSPEQINGVFAMESPALLEELVRGTEITVPVLDSVALPVIEIHPPQGKEFDYENKYNGESQEACPPISVPEHLQKAVQEIAEKVHKIMGCRHLSRTDMMITPEEEIIVFDVNTMPGLTRQSLYPNSAAVAGLPMPELMKRFADLVERDFKLGDKC
jgi:D-alanine-D-alanine ligase